MTDRRDMPSFAAEADALARILALAFDVHRNLETPAEPDVVRLLTEALEHAWLDGGGSIGAQSPLNAGLTRAFRPSKTRLNEWRLT